MTPLTISILAFLGVSAQIVRLAFTFSEEASRVDYRLQLLTGRKKKEDETANILKKKAFERDKPSLLEMLTPKMLSLNKLMEQADCHINPSTLFMVGLILALLGA